MSPQVITLQQLAVMDSCSQKISTRPAQPDAWLGDGPYRFASGRRATRDHDRPRLLHHLCCHSELTMKVAGDLGQIELRLSRRRSARDRREQ
jgi:hypothetical protein